MIAISTPSLMRFVDGVQFIVSTSTALAAVAQWLSRSIIEATGSVDDLWGILANTVEAGGEDEVGQTVPRVLVVEDEFLIARELAAAFEDRGAIVIGPCATTEDATLQLGACSPTLAVIDINLGKGKSFEVPRLLVERGIPFAFVTGYDHCVIPHEYFSIPFYQRPMDTNAFADEVLELSFR